MAAKLFFNAKVVVLFTTQECERGRTDFGLKDTI
jgi:hypothetical protein